MALLSNSHGDKLLSLHEVCEERLGQFAPLTHALVLVQCDGRFVLVENREKGRWELCGGMIDAGETARECAVREAFEESGVTLEDIWFRGVMEFELAPSKWNPQVCIEYGGLFCARVASVGPFVPTDEIAAARLWPRDALPGNTDRIDAGLLAYFSDKSPRGDVVIRRVTTGDIPALFDARAATRENRMSRAELAAIGIDEEWARRSIGHTHEGWLCETDETVAGFCMGDRTGGEVSAIALRPQYERRGIGEELLRRVEEWLRSNGWNEIWLTTDVDTSLRAYGFYRHHGWADWKLEGGLRYMKKQLSQAGQ